MSRFVDSDPPQLRGDNPPRSVEVVCGAGGCRAAVEAAGVAVMVDALRASATITALIAAGARRVWVATEVEQAHAMKARLVQEGLGVPILLGERDGFPPPGFDAGNSPRDALALPIKGRDAVFTSTTGSARLGQLEGVSLAVVGSTVNAGPVARAVAEHAGQRPVFTIAAGLRGAPGGTEEDWIGAAVIAERLTEHDFEWVNRGLGARDYWPATLDADSVLACFKGGAHGQLLASKGLGADVEDCARIDWIDAVAQVVGYRRIDEGPPIAEIARLV